MTMAKFAKGYPRDKLIDMRNRICANCASSGADCCIDAFKFEACPIERAIADLYTVLEQFAQGEGIAGGAIIPFAVIPAFMQFGQDNKYKLPVYKTQKEAHMGRLAHEIGASHDKAQQVQEILDKVKEVVCDRGDDDD